MIICKNRQNKLTQNINKHCLKVRAKNVKFAKLTSKFLRLAKEVWYLKFSLPEEVRNWVWFGMVVRINSSPQSYTTHHWKKGIYYSILKGSTQGSKGIRQRLVNWCKSPIMIQKISPTVYYNLWSTLNIMNQPIKN